MLLCIVYAGHFVDFLLRNDGPNPTKKYDDIERIHVSKDDNEAY